MRYDWFMQATQPIETLIAQQPQIDGTFRSALLNRLYEESFSESSQRQQRVRISTRQADGANFQGNVLLGLLDVTVYTQDETEDTKVTVFDAETIFDCTIPDGGVLVIEAA